MKKNKITKILFAITVTTTLLFTSAFSNGFASAKKALTLSPMNQRIILVPGEIYSGSFSVSNPADSDEDFRYSVKVSPYYPVKSGNSTDDYGGVDYTTKSNMNMIVDWTTVEDSTGVLEPNEKKVIQFKITVPEDAPAGGQYMSLLVREDADLKEADNSTIDEIIQMGHVVYAEVAGETRSEGVVLANDVPSFLTNGKLATSTMVRNNGNVHTDAKYVLQVWPLFSDEEICTNEERPDTVMILPNTQRYYFQECNLPMFGIFRVKQTVKIFGEESVVEKMVIVCPLWLLFIIFFAIVMIIAWLIARSRKRGGRGRSGREGASGTGSSGSSDGGRKIAVE